MGHSDHVVNIAKPDRLRKIVLACVCGSVILFFLLRMVQAGRAIAFLFFGIGHNPEILYSQTSATADVARDPAACNIMGQFLSEPGSREAENKYTSAKSSQRIVQVPTGAEVRVLGTIRSLEFAASPDLIESRII